MFGRVQLAEFEGLTSMPQEAASAWSGATSGLVGATYKPLLYLGWQIVRGVNHYFIAEQSVVVATPALRRIVLVTINGNEVINVEEIL